MRIGRLALKIYLYSVLAVVAAVIVFIASLRTYRSARLQDLAFVSEHLVMDLWQRRDDPDRLRAEASRRIRFPKMQVTLYDTAGQLIASTETPPVPMLSESQLRKLIERGTLDVEQGVFVHPVQENGRVAGVGIVKLHSPSLWWRHRLQVLAVLLVVLLMAVAFARHIARPLQKIVSAAKRFGRGELGARAGINRNDEIGDVGRAFDDMADQVTGLMTAQQELMANVSHELLTPLSRVQVAVDLITDGEPEQAKDLVPEIARDLAEIERLIDDVMTLARLDVSHSHDRTAIIPLRVQSAHVDDLVQEAVSRFRSQCQTHEVAAEVPAGLPKLSADVVLLRRVIQNLLENARKYSEPGSTIRVRASTTRNGLSIVVQDNGIGIDDADLKQVFKPFFRGDRSRSRSTGGVGLGLALAKRVVEAHGGTIVIASPPGQGTTLTIELPAQAIAR